MKLLVCAMFVFSAMSAASASSIPIWDLLSREEKMGRLFYVFVHLVEQYCKTSDIPDCSKVLTLYGMSNLVNDDELELNSLDPYQKNSRAIIWAKIMRGEFKQSTKDVVLSVSQHLDDTDDDEGRSNNVFPSSPYEVRVKPPAGFTYNPSDEVRRSQRPIMLGSTKYDSDLDNSATKLSNNVVLLRPGRGQRSRRSVNRRSILLKSLSSK